jgi:hypothetical protein
MNAYGTGTWNAGCVAGPGICGTAADASGVGSVRVGVLSLSTLRYWNGTTFGTSGQFLLPATGTSSWRLPMPVPPSGLYGVLVSATDSLGNVRSIAQVLLFMVNTTPPPAPVITAHPTASTSATTAQFKWSDSQSGVTFKCSLDSATATPCTSPTTYTNLGVTSHCFSVVAVDALNQTSSPASFCWSITSVTFPITGAPAGAFSPGVSQVVNVSITNPNSFAITVTGITATVSPTTIKNSLPNPACNGSTNLVVSRQFSGSIVIPANSTKTLQALGVAQSAWPQLTMPNLATNQDACKGTSFTITYSGTATL